MLYSAYRSWRRRSWDQQPFPADWLAIANEHCWPARLLNPAERSRWQQRLRWFIREKSFEGCQGLSVTDEMRVVIAAYASLMGLAFPQPLFAGLSSLLIYPDVYVAPNRQVLGGGLFGGGIVIEDQQLQAGQAWLQGSIVLAWKTIADDLAARPVERRAADADTLRAAFAEPFRPPTVRRRNVIVHELAHLIDMEDRETDGVPIPAAHPAAARWQDVMHDEFHRLGRRLRMGQWTAVDPYGSTSPVEYFSTATEAYFEQPAWLYADSRPTYELLKELYQLPFPLG